MSTKHTETPWDFTVFSKPDGSPITTVQDVADTVAHSALQCEGEELWGVSDKKLDADGAVRVICYTGNGPTSQQNAQFISRACNCHADLLAAAKAKLADCRVAGGCSDAALLEGEVCSEECSALVAAIARAEGGGA